MPNICGNSNLSIINSDSIAYWLCCIVRYFKRLYCKVVKCTIFFGVYIFHKIRSNLSYGRRHIAPSTLCGKNRNIVSTRKNSYTLNMVAMFVGNEYSINIVACKTKRRKTLLYFFTT